MSDRQAQWASTEAELRAALDYLRSLIDADSSAFAEELLDHNELGVAMDVIVDAALESSADALPGAVIKHLRRASAEMEGYQPDSWNDFFSRFG